MVEDEFFELPPLLEGLTLTRLTWTIMVGSFSKSFLLDAHPRRNPVVVILNCGSNLLPPFNPSATEIISIGETRQTESLRWQVRVRFAHREEFLGSSDSGQGSFGSKWITCLLGTKISIMDFLIDSHIAPDGQVRERHS